MTKLLEITSYLEECFPPEYAEDFDNIGLLAGRCEKDVKKVLLCLDCNKNIVREAAKSGVQLIITHHPVIFNPVRRIIDDNDFGEMLVSAIENGISIYSAHTNLDSATGGITDTVAKLLGLTPVSNMEGNLGRICDAPKGMSAKTLAEILFGDESCCKRFDMSEYGQSHSDQKLLGAPPGYVGYEAGGQLTNAVKNNPFSILLFDEIEKAHPSILDKFLQILEDGRMTDGQGNTVYFSETIIIFTSNLGIFTMNENGQREANVTSDMPYQEMSVRVREAIEDYFKLQLGRPEILNRIGENIVVFDYIRPDVAKLILNAQVNKIIKNMSAEKHIALTIADSAMETLTEQALNNLQNGGRGIGNVVENLLINPLSRYLFDNEIFDNASVTIDNIDTTATPPSLECTKG